MSDEFATKGKRYTVNEFFKWVVNTCVEIGKLSQQVEDIRREIAEERASRQVARERTVGMDDLVAFLRVRLDEDERLAQRAEPVFDARSWELDEVQHDYYDELAPHIARQSPARTLREVEAKRRLLEQFRLRGDSVRRAVQPSTGGVWDDLLRLLAQPYSDHSDYQESWKP